MIKGVAGPGLASECLNIPLTGGTEKSLLTGHINYPVFSVFKMPLYFNTACTRSVLFSCRQSD